MKMKITLLAAVAILACSTAHAQLNVGSTSAPDASAMLQVSGTTKGFLPPVLTTTQRGALTSPAKGLVIFNSTTNQMEVNTGTTAAPVWTSTSATVADLRLLSGANHISQDAGVGSNGSAIGTGGNTVAIGAGALNAVTSGGENIAIGASALNKNLTGSHNVAISQNSQSNRTAGDNNISIGLQSLNSNSTGSGNHAIGYVSLPSATGSNNIGIGVQSGLNLTSGDGNIALGNNTSFPSASGSNQLNIGNGIYGSGLGTGNSFIGINTSSPSYPLHITQPLQTSISQPGIQIGGASGTAATGQAAFIGFNPNNSQGAWPISVGAQYVNGSASQGNADFVVATSSGGAAAIKFLVQNGGNVGIGTTTPGTKLDVNGSVAIRTLTTAATTDNLVTADVNGLLHQRTVANLVSQADVRATGTAGQLNHLSSDAGVGGNGTGAGTGSYNNAIGAASLSANTTGSYNSAYGVQALQNNTIGSTNVAIGLQSLNLNISGNDNNAVGYLALSANTSSSSNSAFGHQALYVSTGSSNTAMGDLSGVNVTTGSNNTLIGASSGVGLTTGTNNTFLGANTNAAIPGGSNQLNIGNNIFGVGLSGSVSAPLGTIGIRTSTPSTGFALDVNGLIRTTGAVNTTSDARLKTNVTPVTNALGSVMQLNPVSYSKKTTIASNNYNYKEIGFIAQDLRKVFPSLVVEDQEGDKLLSVKYQELIPVLTKAIQEQQVEIESKNKKISDLEARLEKLEKAIAH